MRERTNERSSSASLDRADAGSWAGRPVSTTQRSSTAATDAARVHATVDGAAAETAEAGRARAPVPAAQVEAATVATTLDLNFT